MIRVHVKLESGLFNQAAFRRSLQQVVTRFTFALESTVKISIQQGPKTGRVYQRRAIRKRVGAKTAQQLGLRRSAGKFIVGFGFHRASAPGQPPASDTGNLVNSVKGEAATIDARGVHAKLRVNANYGQFLEEGTDRMAKRPYIAPAIRKEQPKFIRAVNNVVAQAVR